MIKTLKPTPANAGIEIAYLRKIRAFMLSLSKELTQDIRIAFGGADIVQDGATDQLKNIMENFRDNWLKSQKISIEKTAIWFAGKNKNYTDGSMQKILRDSGLSARFSFSLPSHIFEAVVAENVGLISNLAVNYISGVESAVMRSVIAGRDLASLTKELKTTYEISDKRARFIARDQNNKATAVIVRNNQEELGITEALWRHSHAGKHPRPSHVAADNMKYEIKNGMYLEGKWTWPGVEINCRCVSRGIIPGYIK